jgi:hypothetical protein
MAEAMLPEPMMLIVVMGRVLLLVGGGGLLACWPASQVRRRAGVRSVR